VVLDDQDHGLCALHAHKSRQRAEITPSAAASTVFFTPSRSGERLGLQHPIQRLQAKRIRTYDPDASMYRRGNYNSGEDFVLEYGELRFTFSERDFRERCEQAARKLGFLAGAVEEDEAEDLINLVVNGEVTDPASGLGEHVNECWPELVGPSERSLVHWLRRLIFRGAWLDQRVKEGELDITFNANMTSFVYVQPDRGGEPIELAPEPSWNRVAYVRR
jgi:hypothetical protein